MDSTKDRMSGIMGTMLFHLIVILLLFLFYIQPTVTNRSTQSLEGVPVMFGNTPDALGDNEGLGRDMGPINKENTAPSKVDPSPAPVVEKEVVHKNTTPAKVTSKPVVTQDFEETVAVKEKKIKEDALKKQQAILADQEKKAKAEAAKQAAILADKAKSINNQMSGVFGNGSGTGSRGNTEGTGTQGVPTGNASYGKTSGIGGTGSYDLGGRSVGRGGLVQPAYTVDDYGTVVIDIIVDPKGNVVEATIGRKTNTTNSTLQNESLKAARRTKFNVVNTVGNQKGTITYKFNLN